VRKNFRPCRSHRPFIIIQLEKEVRDWETVRENSAVRSVRLGTTIIHNHKASSHSHHPEFTMLPWSIYWLLPPRSGK
jgi:hypothetical protein